jgi:hypothetical protein
MYGLQLALISQGLKASTSPENYSLTTDKCDTYTAIDPCEPCNKKWIGNVANFFSGLENVRHPPQ